MEPTTPLSDALVRGLVRQGGGAVRNGDRMAPDRSAQRTHIERNGPVEIKRLPVRKWSCDSCQKIGRGPDELLDHYSLTSHAVFTEEQ